MNEMKPSDPTLRCHRPYVQKWWKSEGVVGEIFATQGALKQRIRVIAHSVPLDTPLGSLDAEFIIDVLRRHHRWSQKQGTGVAAVVVRLNPPPGFGTATRGFWLIRSDQSAVDISWMTPLQPGGASNGRTDVSLAARREVSAQTRAVFELNRGKPCPICGKPLNQGHVDHIAPLTFQRLLTDWLRIEGVRFEDVDVADLGVENAFADREFASRWAEYHSKNAKLRVIHPNENLAMTKEDRIVSVG